MPLRRRPPNRRKSPRVRIDAALAMMYCLTDQGASDDTLPPLITEDISPDGLFLRTTRALPEGTLVTLNLHLPTMTHPLSCQARVARVEHRRNGEVRGVGLEFVDQSEGHRQMLIEHLYKSYQVQHAGE